MSIKHTTIWSLLLFAAIFIGCGRSNYTVPAQIIVRMNNEPVEQATVSLSGEDGCFAVGETDATGKAELFTLENGRRTPGALPGKYRVSIEKMSTEEKTTGEGPSLTVHGFSITYHVPKKYAGFETSGLTAEIQNTRKNLIEFDLDGKP